MKVAVTILASTVAALLGLGLVMLYSSSMTKDGTQNLVRQLVWVVISFMACVALTRFDYRNLKESRLLPVLYAGSIVVLALVFVPHIGIKSHAARRWIGHSHLELQPSEFAKIALIIVLAWYADRYQRQMSTWGRGTLLPVIIIAPVLALIFIEPDRGQTILLSTVCLGMLVVAGVRLYKLFLPAAGSALALYFSLKHDHMRTGRIQAWLHPDAHAGGAALQAVQAMYGLGDGGWFGLGLGNGLRKFGYLPEIHTDFILACIGEELGLLATLSVILGFVVIALCGFYIALHARDAFGGLLALGLTLLICLQATINIGVVTSALPNKGLPLPFISYGGSNLLAMFICLGILFSIARQGEATVPVSPATGPVDDNPFAARTPRTA